ncbi:MAG: methyltransferase domain-containing protein [Chthoniobacterales bacterium]
MAKAKTSLARRFGWLPFDWEGGLSDEVKFWADALRDPGKCWNEEDYNTRLDPNLPLQPELRKLVADADPHVRILDVGAGPLTRVGRCWDGRHIEIVAVDPLAPEYDAILEANQIQPPVRTIECRGEDIGQRFADHSFDICYASNALDHALSPTEVIRQMGKLTKVGGSVYLWHFLNCGVQEQYHGLHQWNFNLCNGDMSIDNGRQTHKLSQVLDDQFQIECRLEHAFDTDVVVAIARRMKNS